MSLTVETLNILLLLLPGFMSGQILYSVFRVDDVSVPKRVLDAIIFSFLIYIIISYFSLWEPLASVQSIGGKLQYSFTKNHKIIWLSLVIMVIIPILLGVLYHSDLINSVLRKFNITTKTSRNNTWNDVFLSQDRYVVVTLKDNRRIRGYPTMFSTDPEEGYIYLYNPAWVNDDKENEDDSDYLESNCHGFLLHRENIDLIEFTLDPDETLDKKHKVKR